MERMYFYQRKLQDRLTERVERNPRYSLKAFYFPYAEAIVAE